MIIEAINSQRQEVTGHLVTEKNQVNRLVDEDDRSTSPEVNDLDTFTEPNDETRDKILTMVEHLFSDENLMKDAFLLKHVKRNKEGFVSLKLIASLRKVKSVCKQWKQVSFTIDKYSHVLEINEDGTKVRRVNRLPESIELKYNKKSSPIHRQILLTNIPQDECNVDSLSDMLSSHGAINILRLYESLDQPELTAWTGVLTPRVNKQSPCALVEFESSAASLAALLAIQAISRTNWRFTIRPFSLKHSVTVSSSKQSNDKTRRRANTYAHEVENSTVKFETRKKCDSCSSLVTPVSKPMNSVYAIRQPFGPNGCNRGFR